MDQAVAHCISQTLDYDMPWTLSASLLSGDSASLQVMPDDLIDNVRKLVQLKLKTPIRTLMKSSVLDPHCTVAGCGLKDGDEVTAIVSPKIQVRSHKFGYGFAAIMPDGLLDVWGHEQFFGNIAPDNAQKDLLDVFLSETAVAALRADGTVMTCGWEHGGGDSSSIKDELTGIVHIEASRGAFAGLRADGSVVTWGSPDAGGDSSAVRGDLVGVQRIYKAQSAFAAVTRAGAVIAWGDPDMGGDTSKVKPLLVGARVIDIAATVSAFGAVTDAGGIISWGEAEHGGDCSAHKDLRGVQRVFASKRAFAAVRYDGSVVTWGDAQHGGDSSKVRESLQGVRSIVAAKAAFAAITTKCHINVSDGLKIEVKASVITWGDPGFGGDSSSVAEQLVDVKQIVCTQYAFAALRSDGHVVCWGSERHGANSSTVQGRLTKVSELFASQSSFAALCTNGDVVTWGHGDDCCDDPELQSELVDIQQVCASKFAFVAVRSDGKLITWGDPEYGGYRPDK